MSFWWRLVPWLGVVVVAAGLAAFFLTFSTEAALEETRGSFPYYHHLVLALPFIFTAAILILGGNRDRRALALGTFCLLVAVPQFNRPLRLAGQQGHLGGGFFELINALEVDCFLPYFIWLFVRDFPAIPLSVETRRRIDYAVKASAWLGIILFSANLLHYLAKLAGLEDVPVLAELGPRRSTGLYYMTILPLTAAAFVTLWWRGRSKQGPEEWRCRLLVPALLWGFGPLLVETLLAIFFLPYRNYIQSHIPINRALTFAVTLPTLIVPPFIAQAVFVHHVLDVRLIARRAVQYALARYSALTLAAAPLIALIYYLQANRTQSINDLFTGSSLVLLISASGVGLAALRYRRTLLDSIDRRFFREQYDARQILTMLVERIRAVRGVANLAKLVSQEIDFALHLEDITFLVVEPRSGMLVDPRHRAKRLDASSKLALLVAGASDPLDVTLEGSDTPFSRLPEPEKHWLVDNNLRLIVPILARDGTLLGMIGLGEKKSGLPYLREDRQLLHAIASNSALVLELEQSHSTPPPDSKPGRLPALETGEPALTALVVAKECATCGTVAQPFNVFCSNCSRRLEASHVPYVLPGKFRFERRIGIGGMGVVYRASDLGLGRLVAVKTLRRVSPEDAMRLRREARTAASVSHPNLAAVHGMETWQGTPMLILELLEGGTLAQRFEKGKLPPGEMLDIGIAMTSALTKLHAADILHRDVKPSNIGFTRDGVPKLMDFGIARLMFDLRREGDLADGSGLDDSSALPPTSIWNNPSSLTASQQLVGTLSYLSPEALDRRAPDVSFDLWGLAIVLYECLLGRKVFTGADVKQLMIRIRNGRVPDFAQVLPELDPQFGDFFRAALHPSVTRRPASASEMRRRLVEIRAQLNGGREEEA